MRYSESGIEAGGGKSKTQELARLKQQDKAAWDAYRASGEPLNISGPFGKRWSQRRAQSDRLESSFVVYRGREVDAVVVAHQSGDITTSQSSCISGDERLYRAPDGTYYLHQEEWQQSPRVRKLNLRDAILWAVTRSNIATPGLRNDVIALFANCHRLEKGAE